MSNSTISLNIVKESAVAGLRLDPAKNRYQQFTFSNQFTRAELAKNFEQNVPSPIVTALNVTKIVPAIFFALEKLSAALESLLNGAVFLLNSAYGALLDSHEIVVMDLETLEKNDPESNEATDASPVSDSEISDLALQDKSDFPVGDDSSTDEITQQTPSTTPAKDDLDSYNDLLVDILEDDSPALSPTPSNNIRNLLIGGGIATAALSAAYIAASYFNYLPDSLNIFGNSTNLTDTASTGLDSESVGDDNSSSRPNWTRYLNAETRSLVFDKDLIPEDFKNYVNATNFLKIPTTDRI